MNKFYLKVTGWVLVILFGIGEMSYGQSVECVQVLNEANSLYDQGRLPEVIKELNKANCLKEGFSREQEARAYRLMALVYVFLDDEPNAEDAIIKLLHVDPEHPYSEVNDPAEFIVLYKKFRYKPIFRVGVFFGVNQSSANSLGKYGSFSFNPDKYDPSTTISKSFSQGIGIQLGGLIEYTPIKEVEILKNFELVFRANISLQNYSVGYPLMTTVEFEPVGEDLVETPGFDFVVSELKETQTWLNTSLAIRYNILNSERPGGVKTKIIPYVIGGASFNYLSNASMSGSREGTTSVRVASLDLKELDMRQNINWSYFGGIGAKLAVQRTKSFFIEGTYNIGGRNFVNGSKRYASQDLNYNIAHIDDDKSLNSININVGFIWSIYKPVKYAENKLARDLAREIKSKEKGKK